jgi:hypothetical protein
MSWVIITTVWPPAWSSWKSPPMPLPEVVSRFPVGSVDYVRVSWWPGARTRGAVRNPISRPSVWCCVGAALVTEPLRTSIGEPGLEERVAALRDSHARLWAATPAELPCLGPATGLRPHFVNARAAARLIDTLAAEVRRLPEDRSERAAWQAAVRTRIQDFGAARLGWPAGYRRLLFADAFYAAALAFVREAHARHPELPLPSLWQALRNVLIGNSLQMLLDLPVGLGPGLFAYSMLYPLTDNLLDDPKVPAGIKRNFNERFGRRLAGLPVGSSGAGDAAVFALVSCIEEELPRRQFEDVYGSLLAIHGGQVRSLDQQDDPRLSDDDILAISCEKGGTSVLADLYLVSGRPSAREERFAFGYGVFLQLLDDLQDVLPDLEAGHQTLFTRAAQRGSLDEPTARLARYIDLVLDDEDTLGGVEYDERKDLIRRNCRSLLVGAIAEQEVRFTRRFRRRVEGQWPFSLRAMRRLRRRTERRFGEAASSLRRRPGAPSLLDLTLREA